MKAASIFKGREWLFKSSFHMPLKSENTFRGTDSEVEWFL